MVFFFFLKKKERNMLFISMYHLVNISWLWWQAKLIVVTCVWDSWRRSQHFFLCGIGLGCHGFTFMYAAAYCETPRILVKWMSVSTQNYKIMFSTLLFYEILQFKKPYMLIFPKMLHFTCAGGKGCPETLDSLSFAYASF